MTSGSVPRVVCKRARRFCAHGASRRFARPDCDAGCCVRTVCGRALFDLSVRTPYLYMAAWHLMKNVNETKPSSWPIVTHAYNMYPRVHRLRTAYFHTSLTQGHHLISSRCPTRLQLSQSLQPHAPPIATCPADVPRCAHRDRRLPKPLNDMSIKVGINGKPCAPAGGIYPDSLSD